MGQLLLLTSWIQRGSIRQTYRATKVPVPLPEQDTWAYRHLATDH